MKLIGKTTINERLVKETANDFGITINNDYNHQRYFIFISILDAHTLLLMYEHLELNINILGANGDYNLCLISGTVAVWKQAIIKAFTDNKISYNISLNKCLELAFNHFKNVEGLGHLFDLYDKKRTGIGLLEFKE